MARISYDDQTAAAFKAVRAQVDTFRRADTNMRGLTEEEFRRGKERLRRAVKTHGPDTRTNWLDLLVLR